MASAEMRLVAKGKTLADDDATLASAGVVDGAKLMLLRSGAAPKPCRVTFRDGLRLQSYGLALKDVELARSTTVGEATAIAEKALKLPAGAGALFRLEAKDMLRPELTLADYDLPERAELFLVPRPPPLARRAAVAPHKEASSESLVEQLGGFQLPPSVTEQLADQLEEQLAPPPAPSAPAPAAAPARAFPEVIRSGLAGPRGAGGGSDREITLTLDPAVVAAALQAELGRSAAGGAASLAGAALEQYETACAEAVGSLASLSPAASNASEERRDKAAWGSGLAKGFLSAAPKRRRRKAAPAAEAAKAAEAAAAAAKAAKVEAEKARGERCAACARRLPLTATLAAKCRCGGCYCNEHRAPECHACNFDFRGAARRRLEADHPKLSAPKIERLSSAVE
jgi:hypothetical protein